MSPRTSFLVLIVVRLATINKRKERWQELKRMWRNWNICTLLAGMQNDTTAIKNNMEIPQKKLKILLPCDPGNLLLSQFSSVQSLSRVWLFATPWIAARQTSLSITNFRSALKLSPSSRWCHPAISSSVVPISSCSQFLPASESFPMSTYPK